LIFPKIAWIRAVRRRRDDAHGGTGGWAMVCVICGFFYYFHRKVHKGRKYLLVVPYISLVK
jgi:hypothetical protein